MKKTITVLLLLFLISSVTAQAPEIKNLNKLLHHKIADTTRVNVLRKLSFYDQNFQHGLELAQKGLTLARKIKYDKGEADCLHQIGNQYLGYSNFAMALHYYLKSLKIRERINDQKGISNSLHSIGYIYYQQADYKKAIYYYKKSLSKKSNDIYRLAVNYGDMGDCYDDMNISDSALIYYQRSYENYNLANDKYQLNITLNGLGKMQYKMGNTELAMGYYRQALKNGLAYKDTLNLSFTNLEIAKLYLKEVQKDSSIFYAKKSLFLAQKANVLKNIIASGKLLIKLYQSKNDEEALHYSEIAQRATDSLFNRDKSMQIQNLFFNETEREKETVEREKIAIEERKQNIQFAFIALGIISFLILFLLLSRSIIVNEKWISFFGILGLLIVFEFVNLLIHPFLEDITHHSPILMLLALVVLASILIPLHHKLEKWIKEKMTEKNKAIRLASAKKTIERLEKD